MKVSVLALAAALCLPPVPALAVYEVGDTIPNLCWKDTRRETCLADNGENVYVLIHGAGWCPACNDEMSELSKRYPEFFGEPVTFLSLSSEGFHHGAPADAAFLDAWQKKHDIPFGVLASPKDVGKKFFSPPIYIPNAVVIGKDRKLLWKSLSPSVPELLDHVHHALHP